MRKDGKTLRITKKERIDNIFPKHLMETGGFLISRAECVNEKTRIGKNTEVFEISENEAVDIDSEQDWIVCEGCFVIKENTVSCRRQRSIGNGAYIQNIVTCVSSYWQIRLCLLQEKL